MTVEVHPANETNAPAIVAMLNPIVAAERYTIMSDPLVTSDMVEWIHSVDEKGAFNVAVENASDRVVGFQCLELCSRVEPAHAHVGDIATFVAIDAQRGGIGSRLMLATIESARRRGFAKVMASIRADNDGAVAFYKGRGFEIIGTARRHAFVRGEFLDEILAERWIGG